MHDVDEDLRTILNHGGEWWRGSDAGISERDMYRSSSYYTDAVASSNMQKI